MSSSEPSPWGPESSAQYGYTGRMMLAAVVCFFIVILLVIFLHIYAKWLMRRRRSDDSFLAMWNPRIPLDRLHVFSHDAPTTTTMAKTGLDASLLALIPAFMYRKAEHSEQLECSICLSLLEEEEEAKMMPKCRHCFHAQCIDSWLQLDSTCPVCRASVVVHEKEGGEVKIELGSDPITHDNASMVMPVSQSEDLTIGAGDTSNAEPGVGEAGEVSRVTVSVEHSVDIRPGSRPEEAGSASLVGGNGCSFGSLRRMLGRNRSERKSPSFNRNNNCEEL